VELDLGTLNRQKNEAKTYFEYNIKPNLGIGNANARASTFSRPLLTEDLNWDKAWIREISFGSALAVPIIYQTELFTPISKDSVTTLTNTSYAQFYHNEQDELVSEIVNIIPDIGSSENEEFSGIIYVQDWEGNFVKGFKHQDGEVYEMQQNNNPLENGRTTTEICQEDVTDWYTCTAIVGIWDWECHYSYTEVTEVCDYVYLPSGGSSGSSGSGGSDDYDPNSGLPGYPGPRDDKPKTADELCGGTFDDATGECAEGELLNQPGFEICNKYIPFDAIPQNDGETSFTGEVNRVHVPAIHTETGEQVEAFWGAWCVTYGTSANNVNNSFEASTIFKQAWALSTAEAEAWLNALQVNPGNIAFSNHFLLLFEENLAILSGGSIQISTGGCLGSVSSTWLTYCN
jgi:hypothetical protein